MLCLGVRSEVAQEWNLRETRPAIQRFRVGPFEQSAQNIDFAIFQADVVLNFALADNRLLDPSDRRSASDRGNLHLHFQAHFMVGVHARRHVQVHADIDVRELRVYKRIHESRSACRTHPDTRLEATCSNRDTITDIQLGRLPLDRANLGVLNDLRVGIGQHRVGRRTRQVHAVILGAEMFQRAEQERGACR